MDNTTPAASRYTPEEIDLLVRAARHLHEIDEALPEYMRSFEPDDHAALGRLLGS